jgi:hypothetical protein
VLRGAFLNPRFLAHDCLSFRVGTSFYDGRGQENSSLAHTTFDGWLAAGACGVHGGGS